MIVTNTFSSSVSNTYARFPPPDSTRTASVVGSSPSQFADFLVQDRRVQGERVKMSGVQLD